jgi:cytochrome c peroxidase
MLINMKEIAPVWDEIVARHNRKPNHVDDLASWWHTDIDTDRPFEVIADLIKGRLLGFRDFLPTTRSFYDLFARLREERIIP